MKITCGECGTGFDVDPGAAMEKASCPECGTATPEYLPHARTQITPPPTEADAPPPMPRRVGAYEILESIGQGGMGAVYKARHKELNRTVALKVMIAGEHASQETLLRFQREARSAASLQHPNIVSVFDVGSADSLYYIVMEFVEGTTLERLVRRESIAPREACRIIRDLARALDYAHQRKIVHRDIKPSNVILDGNGVPKLVDFGLAKSLADDHTLTKTGEIIGTACYMPPEQAGGSMRAVDERSDVYSLGTVLYELLAGRPPFRGETVLAIIKEVEESDPLPPTRIDSDVPRDLETVCLKAMAKEKSLRYATAGDFARDLDNFLSGVPIEARPTGLIHRAFKWTRRHPAATTACLMTILAAGAISTILLWRRSPVLPLPRPGPNLRDNARPHVEIARHEIEKAARYTAEARKERRAVLEKARRELDRAVTLDPSYADAYYLRAVAHRALARTDQARLDLDRAIALDPNHADAYYARILLRLRSFRDRKLRARISSQATEEGLAHEQALLQEDIRKLKTLQVKPEKAWTAEAMFAQTFDRRKQALVMANRAIRENRAFADAYVVRASIKKETAIRGAKRNERLLREAETDCDTALRTEVNNAEAYRVRAEIRLAQGRYADALKDLDEMELIAPDEPQTYLDRALVLEQDPDAYRSRARIARDLDRAILLAPRHATARFHRAVHRLSSEEIQDPAKKFALAREDLDVALDVDSSFLTARIFRLVTHFALKDRAGFEKDMKGLRGLYPHLPFKDQESRLRTVRWLVRFLTERYWVTRTQALARKAGEHLRRKEYAEAESTYREVLRRADDPAVVSAEPLTRDQVRELKTTSHYNLACIHSLQGDADFGIEELEKALRLGYADFDHLLQDPDLANVRRHAGFPRLLDRYRR